MLVRKENGRMHVIPHNARFRILGRNPNHAACLSRNNAENFGNLPGGSASTRWGELQEMQSRGHIRKLILCGKPRKGEIRSLGVDSVEGIVVSIAIQHDLFPICLRAISSLPLSSHLLPPFFMGCVTRMPKLSPLPSALSNVSTPRTPSLFL